MERTLSFLRSLTRNNNRDWFNAHKREYQDALEEFRELSETILKGIVQFDPTLVRTVARDSIFRIYRDIRFSRDKSPYKTHFGCWMTKGGRKSTDAGYYIHLEPENSFMAAGVHSPPGEQLHLIRQEIVFNPKEYLDIITSLSNGKYTRAGRDDMLKAGPAGFPKDFEYPVQALYLFQELFGPAGMQPGICPGGGGGFQGTLPPGQIYEPCHVIYRQWVIVTKVTDSVQL